MISKQDADTSSTAAPASHGDHDEPFIGVSAFRGAMASDARLATMTVSDEQRTDVVDGTLS